MKKCFFTLLLCTALLVSGLLVPATPAFAEEGQAANRTNTATTAAQNPAEVVYQVHMQTTGWQDPVHNGETAGLENGSRRLEGLKVELKNVPAGMRIKYQAHVKTEGWQNWVYDGALAGTEGKALRIEAVKMMLENAPAGYKLQYQVYVQGKGWGSWAEEGRIAGTTGQALRIEAIKIRLIVPDADAVIVSSILIFFL